MADFPWRGGGRFRVAGLDGSTIIKFSGVHTQRTRLTRDIGDFFRKNPGLVRPNFQPFQVRLWVVVPAWRKRVDLDNVAKACLDALTGQLWRDDSQVVSMYLEKVEGETEMTVLECRPLDSVETGGGLEALVAAVEAIR